MARMLLTDVGGVSIISVPHKPTSCVHEPWKSAAAVKWRTGPSGEIVKHVLKGIRRGGKGRGRGQVDGITWDEMERVCSFAEAGKTIAGLRDSALGRPVQIWQINTTRLGTMFEKVDFRLFLWLVCFCVVLGIGITGCGGDEEAEVEDDSDEGVVIENGLLDPGYEYVTWYQASIDGKSMNDLALYQPEIGDILVNSAIIPVGIILTASKHVLGRSLFPQSRGSKCQ